MDTIPSLPPCVLYESPEMKYEFQGKVMAEDVMINPYDSGPDAPKRKFTLYPTEAGSMVTLNGGGPNEEGYSHETVNVYQDDDHEGRPCWRMQQDTRSKDCDGRMDHHWEGISYGELRTAHPIEAMRDMTLFKDVRSSQRDYSAEAMGY